MTTRRRLISCLVICVAVQTFFGLTYIFSNSNYYMHSIGKYVLENEIEFRHSINYSKRKASRPRDHRPKIPIIRRQPQQRQKGHKRNNFELHINSTEDIRKRLVDIEGSLFTSSIWTVSDSECNVPYVEEPTSICRNITWHCGYSPTFTYKDKNKSTLKVNCEGPFRVNFVTREEGEFLLSNNKYSPDAVYHNYQGPTEINFTTQYADVICNKSTNGNVKEYHNYRTQFIPNKNAEKKQRQKFDKTKEDEPDWQPLSILSINLDSLSRPQFHRTCGLPKTAKYLHQLYYAQFGGTSSGQVTQDYNHQAFLFNRANSIGGVTAMNLTPLYAGIYFSSGDDQTRITEKRFTKKVNEWIWDYANERGYVTSYGLDNGNGLFGTRTVCKNCTDRPGVLPYWEHGWVKLENKEISPGVLSGLCVGDHMAHDYILNYTRDFLKRDYPAKWTAFDLNAHHRFEDESINQVDESLVHFLQNVLSENKNLVVLLFGDHGDQYHRGNLNIHPGSQIEVFLPFVSMILPHHVLESNPKWRSNLLINSQRYMVFYDLHQTMKSLMHYPKIHEIKGHIHDKSYNILNQTIPRSRGCYDARVPLWSCACRQQKVFTGNWTNIHKRYAEMAADEINKHHAQHPHSPCMDVTVDKITSVVEQTFEYGGRVKRVQHYIQFDSQQGPSKWQVHVNDRGSFEYLKQISRYQKYEDCRDVRVSIEFCICRQFSSDTP